MKEIIKNLYYALFKEDLIQIQTKEVKVYIKEETPKPPRTNRDKLLELAIFHYDTDPTPKDEHPDEFACVHSLTTILKKLLPDFKVISYTPDLLKVLQKDTRFKPTTEFKEGNIIISPTLSGNGTVIGHTGIIGRDGKIYSNASSTGLWYDKYDLISWIDRYSRKGGLSLYIFEIQ